MIALKAIQNPKAVPLTSIALLQQTSQSMTWTIYMLFRGTHTIAESFSKIRRLYEIDDIENLVKDGGVTYPRTGDNATEGSGGMKIEFR